MFTNHPWRRVVEWLGSIPSRGKHAVDTRSALGKLFTSVPQSGALAPYCGSLSRLIVHVYYNVLILFPCKLLWLCQWCIKDWFIFIWALSLCCASHIYVVCITSLVHVRFELSSMYSSVVSLFCLMLTSLRSSMYNSKNLAWFAA